MPTVVQSLLQVPGVETADLSSLQLLMYGASPIGEVLLRRALGVLKCQFMQAYGMTESSGTVVELEPEDHDPDGPRADLLRSCGRALPWVELRVVDPDDAGRRGDRQGRRNLVAHAHADEGLLEQARSDARGDHYRRLVSHAATPPISMRKATSILFDRFKDMIVSGGENVYPAEIENVLNAHPAVLEVGVIGAPHERWIETPVAVVVLRPGHSGRRQGPDRLHARAARPLQMPDVRFASSTRCRATPPASC